MAVVCKLFFINLFQKPEKEVRWVILRDQNQSVLWLVHRELLFFVLFVSVMFFLKDTVLKAKRASLLFDNFPEWILHIYRKDGFYLCRVSTAHTVASGSSPVVDRRVGTSVNGRVPFQRRLPLSEFPL